MSRHRPSIAELSRRSGIPRHTIHQRLLRGWPTERAISEPVASRVLVTIDGETRTAHSWARRAGIDPKTVYARIHRLGWDPVRAVTEPVQPQERK